MIAAPRTDARGRFEFTDLKVALARLSIAGPKLLPTKIDIGEGLPAADVVVLRRCRFRVAGVDAGARGFRLLDGKALPLTFYEFGGAEYASRTRAPLASGVSGTYCASIEVRSLVLLDADSKEIERLPARVDPTRTTVLGR